MVYQGCPVEALGCKLQAAVCVGHRSSLHTTLPLLVLLLVQREEEPLLQLHCDDKSL